MTPEQFIALWKDNPLTERAGAQAWFDDLCDLLGVAKPRDPDNYCFERGAGKSGGAQAAHRLPRQSSAQKAWDRKMPASQISRLLTPML